MAGPTLARPRVRDAATVDDLYERDFEQWTRQQAALLREGRFADLDVANLAEEVEDSGRSLRRELRSRLKVLAMHLLKCQHRPDRRSPSWDSTIAEQRDEIATLLRQNPGLAQHIDEALNNGYPNARIRAAIETQLPLTTFPESCPYTTDQILDGAFDPAPPGTAA